MLLGVDAKAHGAIAAQALHAAEQRWRGQHPAMAALLDAWALLHPPAAPVLHIESLASGTLLLHRPASGARQAVEHARITDGPGGYRIALTAPSGLAAGFPAVAAEQTAAAALLALVRHVADGHEPGQPQPGMADQLRARVASLVGWQTPGKGSDEAPLQAAMSMAALGAMLAAADGSIAAGAMRSHPAACPPIASHDGLPVYDLTPGDPAPGRAITGDVPATPVLCEEATLDGERLLILGQGWLLDDGSCLLAVQHGADAALHHIPARQNPQPAPDGLRITPPGRRM